MNEFRTDNTDGYTDEQLDSFNNEWSDRVAELGIEPYTDEYDNQLKWFNDEIARRQPRGGLWG